jgi:sterol 3beta-glucosyltransferase
VGILVHFVSTIHYGWILPRVCGVIHLGGSGNTNLGLIHGCATLVIPHTIAQFAWIDIIHQIRVGPKGMKIGKITTESLEPKILDLVHRDAYKRKVEKLASQIREEDYREELYKAIIGE